MPCHRALRGIQEVRNVLERDSRSGLHLGPVSDQVNLFAFRTCPVEIVVLRAHHKELPLGSVDEWDLDVVKAVRRIELALAAHESDVIREIINCLGNCE